MIMNEIGRESDTMIQVCSCANFLIVKGETSSKEILNLSEILDKFHTNYKEHKLESSNIIDLINYGKKIKLNFPIKFSFGNGENCSIPILENTLDYFSTSYFPYGFSLSCYRSIYYYFKNIVYNIPSSYPFKNIIFDVHLVENKIDFNVSDDYRNTETDFLKSTILDCFDFDLTNMTEELKKVDLDIELLDGNSDISIIKKKNKDFIIM